MERYVIKTKTSASSSLSSSKTCDKVDSIKTTDKEKIKDDENNSSSSEDTLAPAPQKRKKYSQKYKAEWANKFGNWLNVTNNNKAYCKSCDKIIIGGITHIRRHEKTNLHQNNIKKCSNTPKLQHYVPTNKFQKLDNQVKSTEIKLVMFLHEHNLPFLLMEHLVKLLPSACPDSEIAKKIKCSRSKSIAITKSSLADEAVIVIKQKIGDNVFSLIIDETTDVSTKKSLAIVIRFFYGDDVKDVFLSLLQVASADAKSIFNSICQKLNELNIPLGNMIGLAADNAAVMMGELNGVKAKFKEINPNIFVLGCVCHSFHLCASAAANKLPKSVEDFARSIFNYFSNSSKRKEALEEFQKFLNIKPHKLLRPSQTRWLSLQACVDRILESWEALKLFFIDAVTTDNLHSTQMILSNLNSPIYKIYFSFLSYILDIVNKLNLEFQSESPKLHLLLARVSDLYKTILRNYINRNYIDTHDIQNIAPSDPRNFLPIENIYFGAKTQILIDSGNVDASEIKNFKLRAIEFYIELCKQIKNRFDFNNPTLSFISTFNPKIALSGDIPSIVTNSLKFFPQLVDDVEQLNTEWRLIADITELKKHIDKDFLSFWNIVFNMKNEMDNLMFPNLTKLVKGILCLPHSSAAAERVFSKLNLLKTKTRNRLEVDTCDAILLSKQLMECNQNTCYNFEPSKELINRKITYSEESITK